jgi:arylformamidase
MTMKSRTRLLFALCIVAMALMSSSCILAARTLYRDFTQSDEKDQLGLMAREAHPVDVRDLPPDLRIVRDVAYGSDPNQKFDVYRPKDAKQAPVLFMVHGGGWSRGDKTMSGVVTNKIKRWAPMGMIVISVDYRFVPQVSVEDEAEDIATALATAQRRAAEWGGDPSKFILMGHSAGAHLIGLLTSSPALAKNAGARPWLGSVLLDSGAFDVGVIMRGPHLPLFDHAFGSDPSKWNAVSPTVLLDDHTAPVLAVCSSRRAISCTQAETYVLKAKSFGTHAAVLREDLSHVDIDYQLGQPGDYTSAVETFFRSIGVSLAASR